MHPAQTRDLRPSEVNSKSGAYQQGITTGDVINLASTGIVIALAKAQEQKIDLILKIHEIRVIEARLENQHLLVQPVVWRQNGMMIT